MKTKRLPPLLYGAAVCAFVIFSVSVYGLHATSATEFCMSCHEMRTHAEELKFSSHALDADGKSIQCFQCHIPPGYGLKFLSAKAYMGIKDVAAHLLWGEEALDRMSSQPTARRFIDDANCLNCHADLYRNAKGEGPVSEYGKLAHAAYEGKNGATRSNCAGCHINIAHLPAFDRWLDVNRTFAARLQEEAGQ
jgi:nitrate/TMAO reductase-like tetraheme cytochrome c subunit